MNNLFYQHVLAKELLFIASTTEDIELGIHINPNYKASTLSKLDATKELFTNGLNINAWITHLQLNELKTEPLLEALIYASDENDVLKLCIDKISKDFMDKMPYVSQCNIVEKILDKQIKPKIKNDLLSAFFDKGFQVIQGNIHSTELDWLRASHVDFFDILFEKQPSFNWSHNYIHPYYEEENRNLLHIVIEEIEETSKLNSKALPSNIQKLKAINFYLLKDRIDKITKHEFLESSLIDKEQPIKQKKI